MFSQLTLRDMRPEDLTQVTAIWNSVVEDGVAFPQTEPLTAEEAAAFFAAQTAVRVCADGERVFGMYILHPNNVGRCGHIGNASFAVRRDARGLRIGEKLVTDCLNTAREAGFRIMQFNAVVKSNTHARHLYECLGFIPLGTIPGGFLMKNGEYEDIVLYYHTL